MAVTVDQVVQICQQGAVFEYSPNSYYPAKWIVKYQDKYYEAKSADPPIAPPPTEGAATYWQQVV